MKVVVVDTSALIRLYVPDGPIPDDLEAHISSALRAETTLVIPELALAEFAQVLWKKEQSGYLSTPEVDEIMSAFLELPIEVFGHYDILSDALSLARRYSLSIYDALFLALAGNRTAELVTADQRLKKVFESLQKMDKAADKKKRQKE
jgi:predicted nucleic acid-binding protein